MAGCVPPGFIGTIEDDDEVEIEDGDESEEDEVIGNKVVKKAKDFVDGFEFSVESLGEKGGVWEWGADEDVMEMAVKRQRVQSSTLDAKILRAREMLKLKTEQKCRDKGEGSSGEGSTKGTPSDVSQNSSEVEDESSEEDEVEETEEEKCGSGRRTKQDKEVEAEDESEGEQEDVIKEKNPRKISGSFFEEAPVQESGINFTDMNISRPLLKAVTSLGYVTPTPIQASTVPVALLGKDICACAVTGSGKTAAFFLPILERLLFRPTYTRVTRVLILTPTRELAIQVHSVGKALAKHMNVDFCLATGGLDSKSQEAALRKNPDIVIATPGRLVDHLHNAPSFSLSTVEILILDEADRMLDEHFEDQMNEIIKLCPVKRQTMLFSATMTDKVEELVRLSLKHPVRLFVDGNTDVASNLRQEFVRIKPNKEEDREAILVALCCRSFKEHCLVFLPTKKLAHRMRIIFGLLGLKAVELHGALTQLQRIESLKAFAEGVVDFMLATDLASRGLDIERVKTVINISMPSSLKQYIHRVGRTARAGRSGRSISLVGEKERKVLKEIVKQAKRPVKSRTIPPEVIVKYRDKIRKLGSEIKAILKQEEEEKQLRLSEMAVNKAKNLVEHKAEILSRPARTWIQAGSKRAREVGKDAPHAPLSKRAKKEEIKKKMKKAETPEEKAALKLKHEQEYIARVAKRARKKKKSTLQDDKPQKRAKVKRPPPVIDQGFDKELTNARRKVKDSRSVVGMTSRAKGNKFKSKKRYKRR